MNRKKAFTLIELMIVVAVMGVFVEAFWAPGQTLLGIDHRTRKIIDDNYAAVKIFNRLKKFSAARDQIVEERPHQLLFADGASIILDADRRSVTLSQSGQNTVLEPVYFIQPLKKLDAKTFSLQMQINGETLNTVWRCGK